MSQGGRCIFPRRENGLPDVMLVRWHICTKPGPKIIARRTKFLFTWLFGYQLIMRKHLSRQRICIDDKSLSKSTIFPAAYMRCWHICGAKQMMVNAEKIQIAFLYSTMQPVCLLHKMGLILDQYKPCYKLFTETDDMLNVGMSTRWEKCEL